MKRIHYILTLSSASFFKFWNKNSLTFITRSAQNHLSRQSGTTSYYTCTQKLQKGPMLEVISDPSEPWDYIYGTFFWWIVSYGILLFLAYLAGAALDRIQREIKNTRRELAARIQLALKGGASAVHSRRPTMSDAMSAASVDEMEMKQQSTSNHEVVKPKYSKDRKHIRALPKVIAEDDPTVVKLANQEKMLHFFASLAHKSVPYQVRLASTFIQVIFSTIVCFATIQNFSSQAISVAWSSMRTVFLGFFLLDFMIRAKSYDGSSFLFLTSFISIADALTIVSMTYSFNYWLSFGFLRSVVALRSISQTRNFWMYGLRVSNVTAQKMILLSEAATLVYTFACIIFILENIGDPSGTEYDPFSWSYFTSVYFTFITAATVHRFTSLLS
jgi:hypothetical protein